MDQRMHILVDKKPQPAKDLIEWGEFMGKPDRIVAQTEIQDVRVSTVFLGIDHSFFGSGSPLWFETMIFGGEHDMYQERCSTWEEAEQMHKRACELVVE